MCSTIIGSKQPALILIVNDYFGGKIIFSHVVGNPKYTHYWNELPNGKQVDLTKDQFPKNVKLIKSVIISRKETLNNKRIQKTHSILRRKVIKYIKDNY